MSQRRPLFTSSLPAPPGLGQTPLTGLCRIMVTRFFCSIRLKSCRRSAARLRRRMYSGSSSEKRSKYCCLCGGGGEAASGTVSSLIVLGVYNPLLEPCREGKWGRTGWCLQLGYTGPKAEGLNSQWDCGYSQEDVKKSRGFQGRTLAAADLQGAPMDHCTK